MSRRSTRLLKAALSAMYYSGADGLLSPLAKGAGAILMLHQVVPGAAEGFSPNRILRVTPEFLDKTIRQVIEAGFEILSLDELVRKLSDGEVSRPFVSFTLDDAYRDNLVHAYPVFKRYGIPFTIYAPTDYLDGRGDLWWLALENALARLDRITVRIDGMERALPLTTCDEKDAAYHTIYWWLRRIDEADARATVGEICREANYDIGSLCSDLIMSWDELRTLAADPLVTIGAHTRRHFSLAKLTDTMAHAELSEGRARLERELGKPVRHVAYPFGDETAAGPREFSIARELGFASGVTTRKGLVQAKHASELTALPRVSLNGDYQDPRYVKVLLSGAPFVFWNLFHKIGPKQIQA